jgi:hypothetical protein
MGTVAEQIVTSGYTSNLLTAPTSPLTPESTDIPAPLFSKEQSRAGEESHAPSGPSPSPDSWETLLPTPTHYAPGCGHPLHSAYASTYRKSRCPHCFMTHHLGGLHTIQGVIADGGGVQHWLEEAKDSSKSQESQMHEFQHWRAATKGGDGAHRKYIVRDKLGCDVSNRHCKKMLASLLPKIEEIAEREVAWEQDFRLTSSSMGHQDIEEVVKGLYTYSGQATLELYRIEEDAGHLTRVEDEAHIFMRNRGREREIATASDYPSDQDEAITTHMYNQKTQAHSTLPKIAQDYTPSAGVLSPTKRVRRQINTAVSFSPEVKVCIAHDIDVLRDQARFDTTTTTTFSTSESASTPGRSILRTVPLVDQPPVESAKDIGPKRPYQVYALSNTYATTRLRACWHHYNNPRPQLYEPWTWAASPGSEPVDTSGAKRGMAEWEAYNTMLAREAAEVDKEEEESDTTDEDEEVEDNRTDKEEEADDVGRATELFQWIKTSPLSRVRRMLQ